jgi:hypothetical protein
MVKLKCWIIIVPMEFLGNINIQNESEDYSRFGWIIELGQDSGNHIFGGSSWEIIANEKKLNDPHLLLSLNAQDERIAYHFGEYRGYLPICSYINCVDGIEPQHYEFNSEKNEVRFITERTIQSTLDPDDQLPQPLIERNIRLRRMRTNETVFDDNSYWQACDGFVGGESFIRVFGEPLWLQERLSPFCIKCERNLNYICSIGYQNDSEYSCFLENEPFFIGEIVLYFFVCFECSIVSVLSQST